MASAGTAYVLVKGDFGPLRAGLRHSERSMGQSLGRMESRAQRVSRRVGQVAKVGGIALAAGLGVAAKKAFQEFEEAERVTRQTQAVLKSTGKAAGVSAKEIETLAQALSKKIGVDDEAIQSAENLLLTFTSVRNEVGDGNDIFNQATEVITDMSAALDQDLKSSTIQVGKALQDPIKGITALRRVGVNFNKEQTETVKKMVESGRTMDAQKFILRELRTEFEGSAEAQATASDKLRVSLNNVLESLGRGFAPVLEEAAKSATKFFDDVNAVFENKELTADEKFDRIGDLIADRLEDAAPVIGRAAAKIGPKIAEGLVKGFFAAPLLVQFLAGAWLVAKSRKLLAAFGLLGKNAGKAFSAGAASTTVAPIPTPVPTPGVPVPVPTKKRKPTDRVSPGGVILPPGVGDAVATGTAAGAGASLSGKLKKAFEKHKGRLVGAGNFAGALVATGLTFKLADDIAKDEGIVKSLKNLGKVVLPGHQTSQPVGGGPLAPGSKFTPTPEALSGIRDIRQAGNLDELKRRFADSTGEFRKFIGRQVTILERDLARKAVVKFALDLSGSKEVSERQLKDIVRSLDDFGPAGKKAGKRMMQALFRQMEDGGQLPKGTWQRLQRFFEREDDRKAFRVEKRNAIMFAKLQLTYANLEATTKGSMGRIIGSVGQVLQLLGVTSGNSLLSFAGGLLQGGSKPKKKAVGGMIAGAGKRDTVPIMAAPGEAILNRHQQAPVETALRTTYGYGLQDLFKKERRPHYMAKGGFVPGYARGGIVTGDLDMGPALLRALRKMAEGTGRSISVQSGGRTIGEQEQLYARYLAGGNLAAKPSPNAPHVRGVAADISPGRDVFGRTAGRYGLGFTVPSEPWHIEILSGKGGRATADVAPQEVTRVVVRGPRGAFRDIAQGAADKVRQAAQALLNKNVPMPGEDGGVAPSIKDAKGSGADLMRQIAKNEGWSFADWWEIDRRESAHGTNLVNPTSTARLRGQFLDFNWGKYGPGSDPRQNPSMREQILSMAQYIKERYGNPSRALAKHNLSNWYAQGGFVEPLFASAGKPPGVREVSTARKKPEPPKGLKTPRRNALQRHRLAKKIVGKGKRRKPITLPPGFDLRQLDFLNVAMDKTIPGIQERISSLDQQFSLTDPDFYPDERALTRLRNAGHNIQKFGKDDSAQYIDWTAVGEKKNQLSTLLGESYKLIATPFGAQPMGLMESVKLAFPPLMEGVTRLVKRLEDQITEIKRKVRENIRRIRVLDQRIRKEREKKEKDRDEDKIKKWDDEREKLGTETRRLTGQRRPESVQDIQAGSDSGRLGDLLDKQEKAQQALTDLEEDKQSFIGLSGEAGDYGTQKIDIQRLLNELGELSTDRIKEAIDTPKDEKNRDAQNFLVNIAELFKQYGSNFQRIIPTFATGGTVDGPIGQPRIIQAHAGEEVLSVKQLKLLKEILEKAGVKGENGGRVVNQTINFQTQPRDFHTFARSALVEEQQV